MPYARVVRLEKLPGWVVDDAQSVRDEVAHLIGTTPEQRWRLAVLCARDALWALRAGGNAAHALAHEDPLPASTVAALARLRARSGWGRGGAP
jgi:hypothetical protein